MIVAIDLFHRFQSYTIDLGFKGMPGAYGNQVTILLIISEITE